MCYHSVSSGSCAVRCGLGIFGACLCFLINFGFGNAEERP